MTRSELLERLIAILEENDKNHYLTDSMAQILAEDALVLSDVDLPVQPEYLYSIERTVERIEKGRHEI